MTLPRGTVQSGGTVQSQRPCIRSALRRDERGVVFTEYVVILVLVTLLGAVAIAGLGLPLLRHFVMSRLLLLFPIP